MNADTKKSIDTAIEMANDHSIPVAEIWVGPSILGEIRALSQTTGSPDSGIARVDGKKLFYQDLRVRAMVDEGVRAGTTTCEFGPGVT